MRSICLCLGVLLATGPALADSGRSGGERGKVSVEEIRSGVIVDDGLELPHIRSGTQYFEIHGSRRITRALSQEDRLPTELARGAGPELGPEPGPEQGPEQGPPRPPAPAPTSAPMPEPMIDLPSGPGLPDEGAASPVEQAAAW